MDVDRPEVALNVTKAKGHGSRLTKAMSVGVKMESKGIEPPHKKMKAKMSTPSTVPDSVSTGSISGSQERMCNKDGYVIDVVKKRLEYIMKDLPMNPDNCWSRSFIPTTTLWCSIQNNIWNVPDDEFAVALQAIFHVVYPDVKYRVNTSSSVFSLASQRVSEWHSGIGSTALIMMIDFFSQLDDDADIRTTADYLKSEYRFLREDPDSLEPAGMFRSVFLLELLTRTHLVVASSDFVKISGWDLLAVAGGNNGAGVVALAEAALERAINFIANRTIDVEKVLAEWASSANSKNKIKLPKVVNPLTGRGSSALYQFSTTHWSSDTTAYKESLLRRGADFIQGTFAATQAIKKPQSPPDGDNPAGASGAHNPHACLCKIKHFVLVSWLSRC
ncbi:hypothetical protein JVT61DRAFT_9886 [Boletus reticuloceps]|uniref:Uncharacterized protein n=1 Tax=Boletus reticuloceps TaxID=495285 RepID=A0A8I2YFV3_9AGAM|nr:hypothetical protein JVT61DRAFT_9886 [Boletus reticuloceps]